MAGSGTKASEHDNATGGSLALKEAAIRWQRVSSGQAREGRGEER